MNAPKNVKIITSEYLIYTTFPEAQELKFFSFLNYFLRLYYDLKSSDTTKYNWLLPEVLLLGPDQVLDDQFIQSVCDSLERDSVDILAVSVYVWNKVQFNVVCEAIKKRLPNIIIVAGGPELDAHKNKDFFKNYPWYDYVIYGDGEKAFTHLLDKLAGFDVELINVVSNDGTIYPHEVFNDKSTLKESPYLKYKDEIKTVLYDFRNKYIQKFGRKPSMVAIWETTKGCPYTCTFCDWSSGLHNKVRFWGNKIEVVNNAARPVYEKELDFFTEVKFEVVQWSNPNVGLGPQDADIVDYWCKLKERNPDSPSSFIVQLSKVKKDIAHGLYKKMIRAGLEDRIKFDIQDLDPVVIENLDRPEIPWAEHKVMIKGFVDEFPALASNFKSKINYIWGLPGQTLQHYDYNIVETTNLGFQANFFYFELLPNSPASDPEYIKKYELNIEKIYVTHVSIPIHVTELTPKVLKTYFTESNLITGSYSMSKKDWYTGVVKHYIYRQYFFNVMNKKVDKFLANFYKYQPLVDDMYEHFLQTKIVAIFSQHLMNSGLYLDFRKRMQQITDEIYPPRIAQKG
jgi:hypothetical protein